MSRSSSCSKSTKLYCVKSVSCILGIYYFTANHRLVHIYFTVFYNDLYTLFCEKVKSINY